MNTIKVSIIIPCFNQAHYLDDTLQSVYNQSYKNWECIIVNDGSTDDTEKTAISWAAKDTRFIYAHKENGGLSNARNTGLLKKNGEFVLFLDADDCIHEDKILKSIQLIASKKADIVISDFRMFKFKMSELKRPYCDLSQQQFSLESIILDWDTKYTIPIHCGLFASHLFENVKFNETLKAKEDWYMWIEVFKQNPKVEYINEVLSFYRKNPESMTRDMSHMRKNIGSAYKQILFFIDDDLKPIFLQKIFDDGTDSILYYYKKQEKYKRYFYYMLVLVILLLVLFFINIITNVLL